MNIKHKIAQIKRFIDYQREERSVLRALRNIERNFNVRSKDCHPSELRMLIEKLAAKMDYYKSEYMLIPNAAYSLLAKYSKQYQSQFR